MNEFPNKILSDIILNPIKKRFTKKFVIETIVKSNNLLEKYYEKYFYMLNEQNIQYLCDTNKIKYEKDLENSRKKLLKKSKNSNFPHYSVISKYSSINDLQKIFNKFMKPPKNKNRMIDIILNNKFLEFIAIEELHSLSKETLIDLYEKFIMDNLKKGKSSKKSFIPIKNKLKNTIILEIVEFWGSEINVDSITKELDYLKKNKEELYNDFKKSNSKNKTCKGICEQFKVTRPPNGKRYDSGQARCQICDEWIDYRGIHQKDQSPATEDSVGGYCNCCNYRVRRKPRNRIYKEKLRGAYKVIGQKLSDDINDDIRINQNPCPKCGIIPTAEDVESVFGMRKSGGKSIRQSHCRECRNSPKNKINETDIQDNADHEQNNPNSINEQTHTSSLNELISLSLKIIADNPFGIYEYTLMEKLKISEKEFQKIMPRILRLDNIDHEIKFVNGSYKKIIKEIEISQISELTSELESDKKPDTKIDVNVTAEDIRKEIKNMELEMTKKYDEQIKDREKIKRGNSSDNIMMNECSLIIKYHKKRKDKKFMDEVFELYDEYKSIKKICVKMPWEKEDRIRLHLRTKTRLPEELQNNAHSLLSDPDASLSILLYATDFFNWDGETANISKIMEFANQVKDIFESNQELRFELYGKIK